MAVLEYFGVTGRRFPAFGIWISPSDWGGECGVANYSALGDWDHRNRDLRNNGRNRGLGPDYRNV